MANKLSRIPAEGRLKRGTGPQEVHSGSSNRRSRCNGVTPEPWEPLTHCGTARSTRRGEAISGRRIISTTNRNFYRKRTRKTTQRLRSSALLVGRVGCPPPASTWAAGRFSRCLVGPRPRLLEVLPTLPLPVCFRRARLPALPGPCTKKERPAPGGRHPVAQPRHTRMGCPARLGLTGLVRKRPGG